MEQIVTIELFGQPFSFKSETEIQTAKAVADLLVKEVDKVQLQQSEQSSTISNLTILILAALNIANENMELKRSHSKFLNKICERSVSMIDRLDEIVQ